MEVRGGVLVPVKSGSMLASQTLKFATAGGRGIQGPSEYETSIGPVAFAYLEMSTAPSGFERAALKLTLTQTNEEAVEINPVI